MRGFILGGGLFISSALVLGYIPAASYSTQVIVASWILLSSLLIFGGYTES